MYHERFLKRKRSGWVPRGSESSRTSSATSTSSTKEGTASSIYIHENEHLKHVSWTIRSPWDPFRSFPFRKSFSWNMFRMFIFMNINGTCCTPHGWAWRGRWGCPWALRSPWDSSRSFLFKICSCGLFVPFQLFPSKRIFVPFLSKNVPILCS